MTALRKPAFLLLLGLAAAPAMAQVLTGEVRSDGSQAILVPMVDSSPTALRFYPPEGTRVKKGDVVLRVDAGQAESFLRGLEDQIEAARATADKEIAELELAEIDAEIAHVDALAARDTAAVDAAVPRELLPALDFDRYHGALESTRRDAELKAEELGAAREAVRRRREDARLEALKLEGQRAYNQLRVDGATVRAQMDGVLVHAFQTFRFGGSSGGSRYEEGSSANTGARVGEVSAPGSYSVMAWALAPDRRHLAVDQNVVVFFDALPDVRAAARIRAIGGAPEDKPEWGASRYYSVDIELDAEAQALPLLPGMSARIEPASAAAPIGARARAASRGPLRIEGEIQPRESITISPPAVTNAWMLNVTRMAEDGALVRKGEPVVVFSGGDSAQELPGKQSELKEKERTQEKLKLELADRARNTELATAQARADAEKAERKAEQPEAYVPGIDYKKLVIDRARMARRLELGLRRAAIDARVRAALQRQADVAVSQLERKVKELKQAVAQMTVSAPRDGLFLHHVDRDGSKIDTGSQVWRGQSVASMPDMATLAVRASLAERDYPGIRVGQPVRVSVQGGGTSTLTGTLREIGNSVHSKSRVEPVPVIDLVIELDQLRDDLKPGQPVRIDIDRGDAP